MSPYSQILRERKRTEKQNTYKQNEPPNNREKKTPKVKSQSITEEYKVYQPIKAKKNTKIRLCLQNVNSLQTKTPTRTQLIMKNLYQHKVDVSQMVEINSCVNNNQTWQQISEVTRIVYGSGETALSSVPKKHFRQNNRGGTSTIIHGKYSGNVKKKETDKHGRWSIVHMYRANSPPLVIITAYMPHSQSKPGPFSYQWALTQLHSSVGQTTQIATQFWKYLTQTVNNYQQQGSDVILSLDSNSNPE